MIFAVVQWVSHTAPQYADTALPTATPLTDAPVDAAELERCKVPEFAKAMGHEAKWKQHNHCK
jgi:hypothetical protein